jgi:hypothetical protein
VRLRMRLEILQTTHVYLLLSVGYLQRTARLGPRKSRRPRCKFSAITAGPAMAACCCCYRYLRFPAAGSQKYRNPRSR